METKKNVSSVSVDMSTLLIFLQFHGINSQIEQSIEELSELILALQKVKRHGLSNSVRHLQVCEEIADCFIMLNQLSLIFNRDQIMNYIDSKLTRELKRIETNNLPHLYKYNQLKCKQNGNKSSKKN